MAKSADAIRGVETALKGVYLMLTQVARCPEETTALLTSRRS